MDHDPTTTEPNARGFGPGGLTPTEMERLTRFERRWWLEAHGFDPAEAARLLFFKWLRERRGLES